MTRDEPIERRLLCRKCLKTGTAMWADVSGRHALLSLSQGFHRRPRLPLDLPPQIVCDCGAPQPDH